MPYVIGIVASAGVAVFARYMGFDRYRAFYRRQEHPSLKPSTAHRAREATLHEPTGGCGT